MEHRGLGLIGAKQLYTLSWAAMAGVVRSAILGTHWMTVIISLLTLCIMLKRSCSTALSACLLQLRSEYKLHLYSSSHA